ERRQLLGAIDGSSDDADVAQYQGNPVRSRWRHRPRQRDRWAARLRERGRRLLEPFPLAPGQLAGRNLRERGRRRSQHRSRQGNNTASAGGHPTPLTDRLSSQFYWQGAWESNPIPSNGRQIYAAVLDWAHTFAAPAKGACCKGLEVRE